MSANVKHAMEKFRRKQRILKVLDIVDHSKIENGETPEFVKLYRYLICEYSPAIVENIKRLNIQMRNVDDNKFMENLYKLLRDQFHYHPPLTRSQFFTSGFSEKKIEMATNVCDRLSFWKISETGEKRNVHLTQNSIKISGHRRKNDTFSDELDHYGNKEAKHPQRLETSSNIKSARNKMLTSKRPRDSRPSSVPLQRANSAKLHRRETPCFPMLEILDVDSSRNGNDFVRVEKSSLQYSNKQNEISTNERNNISCDGLKSTNLARRVVWDKDCIENASGSHSDGLLPRGIQTSNSIKDCMQHHEKENGGSESAHSFPRNLMQDSSPDSIVNWRTKMNSPQAGRNSSVDRPFDEGSNWDFERLRHGDQSHNGDVLLMNKLDTIVRKLTHLEQRMKLCEARNEREKEFEVGPNSFSSDKNKYYHHSYSPVSKYSPQSNYGDHFLHNKYPIRPSSANMNGLHLSSSKFVAEKPPLPLKFTSALLNKSSVAYPTSDTSLRSYHASSFLSKSPSNYVPTNGEFSLGNSSLSSTKEIYTSPDNNYFSNAIKNREDEARERIPTSTGRSKESYAYQATRIDSILSATQTLLSARLGLNEASYDCKPSSLATLSGKL